ncbi:hypothetical protein [Halogranum rubrum]|uniref:Uncharacterized protein n=1 Tax=Halogranum salarium B-1 TaxID=1210908 RepID=J3EXC3_9EURY|nr:hypothetical protein [Halogranum salarium]EJN59707.1 hypothetical protein HSB1_18650 [Halogranum salarium B-1]
MSREAPKLDWSRLIHDCRGYLNVEDDTPVPLEELKAQAKAHGFDDAEVDAAVRATDVLEAVDGAVENPRVTLVDETPGETPGESASPAREKAREAFADAVDYFHGQLDSDISDVVDDVETPREHYVENRGWSPEMIDAKRLGYAPASRTGLLDYLMHRGYDREAILGTGLFWDDLTPIWRGRLVLPYLDDDGRPKFAISRRLGEGHPADDAGQYGDGDVAKYHKIPTGRDEVVLDEPIYGVDSVREGEDVLITEGIADAISAHQAGYPCVSPVTTQFKKSHYNAVLDVLEESDVRRVYLVQDNEPPSVEPREVDNAECISDALRVNQFGEGVRGAVRTAAFLDSAGVDARLAVLPRPDDQKVDLDDYLQVWGDLRPVLASAKPARQHPAYEPDDRRGDGDLVDYPDDGRTRDTRDLDPREAAVEDAKREQKASERRAGGSTSRLFDLRLDDVAPVSDGYRGENPLGHHGDSRSYFTVFGDGEIAYDHKYKAAYNALTYLLCDAGERRPDDPSGTLDDEETLVAWARAKRTNALPADDPVPHNALRSVALSHGHCSSDDVEDGWKLPTDAFNAALETIDEEYGVSPGRDPLPERREPVSALPIARLKALSPDDARRAARKRGVEWPTTKEARERLRDRLFQAMYHGEDVVLDAPTALGKSYTVATEPWLNHADVTGESPVIQLSGTREARDDAVEQSRSAGVDVRTLKGRRERCPVAGGNHDPADDDGEDDPEVIMTIGGVPASHWFDVVCDGKGLPFSSAHAYLDENNDQGVDLPCCEDDTDCPAVGQWQNVPRDEETGETTADVVHATNKFAYVPGLVRGANVIFDECPDFTVDLENDRIQRAVTAYLKEIDAPLQTWESFASTIAYDGDHGDVVAERDATEDKIDTETPDREWYLENSDAHALAPALARALKWALRDAPDANERRKATVAHDPPRLDGEAHEDEGWNRVWVTVVVDENNRIQTVRAAPDLTGARCVIGLDAHPATPLWQRNTKPGITVEPVLEGDERRLWRRLERGLTVVQVGDATRPLSSGEYFNEDGTEALIEHLRESYGDDFDSVITASSVESRTARLMRDAGVDDPETMHYGEEKSRNDFGEKSIGLVNGCIDPGDDYVVNLLAEHDLDARPETVEGDDGEERRAHGRGFVGEDADTAAAILASVRENHVAQAAGRYARDADDPENNAVVFVRTDAFPEGFVDLKVSGVEWIATDKQRRVVEALRERRNATAKEIAEATGVSKRHVANTLWRLLDAGSVECRENAGKYGADVFGADTAPSSIVSLGSDEITNGPVWDTYTWAFAMLPPGHRLSQAVRRSDGDVPVEEIAGSDNQLLLGTYDAD